ncbi:MAG: flavodoxin-dependent (E)-4-hydroxy-3-methylbut-2-enyl-diphosphate synthase [Deltaproteobacteria bacterium]|nr:flavodoxin-dependent (E)-4-hydroxy-3-methylbut-2-enyl-diphosphate synthase [Deltaproteobacteria bacterium]
MRKSLQINVGGVKIGGSAPVAVQSMTNTDTRDAQATLAQISRLAEAGCEIVRVAVPDAAASKVLSAICLASPLPVIADIHFDHKLALASIAAGVSGLRINPGNIGSEQAVDAVSKAAAERNIPLRIGVNSGSVEKELLRRFGGPTPEAMVESALGHVRLLEKRNFYNLKISIKSSSVPDTVAAYRMLAEKCDYPLHIGITEAGTLLRGAVKSAVGLGILLSQGLGDTIRVSLTHDPVREVEVAWEILRSLSLRARGPEIISCPTCGRTEIDLISLATQVEERLAGVKEVFTLAVMGCVVNGPGEAKEADLGIAGGRGKGVIFRKGEMTRSVVGGTAELLEALLQEVQLFLQERQVPCHASPVVPA